MYRTGIAVAAVLVTGCAASNGENQAMGMPNPASAYCIDSGGTLMIEDRAGGQVGICTQPDGSKIEEWELFRRDHPQAR